VEGLGATRSNTRQNDRLKNGEGGKNACAPEGQGLLWRRLQMTTRTKETSNAAAVATVYQEDEPQRLKEAPVAVSFPCEWKEEETREPAKANLDALTKQSKQRRANKGYDVFLFASLFCVLFFGVGRSKPLPTQGAKEKDLILPRERKGFMKQPSSPRLALFLGLSEKQGPSGRCGYEAAERLSSHCTTRKKEDDVPDSALNRSIRMKEATASSRCRPEKAE